MNKFKLGLTLQHWFGDTTPYQKGDCPNHGVAFTWNPYGDQEPNFYECCILNSETPSDQVWLGNAHEWYHFYSGKEFRKMAAWVLWRWIWHDWCGLKTRLWLVGLHWICESYKLFPRESAK